MTTPSQARWWLAAFLAPVVGACSLSTSGDPAPASGRDGRTATGLGLSLALVRDGRIEALPFVELPDDAREVRVDVHVLAAPDSSASPVSSGASLRIGHLTDDAGKFLKLTAATGQ